MRVDAGIAIRRLATCQIDLRRAESKAEQGLVRACFSLFLLNGLQRDVNRALYVPAPRTDFPVL